MRTASGARWRTSAGSTLAAAALAAGAGAQCREAVQLGTAPGQSAWLGWALAVDGDVLVAGAPHSDVASSNAGVAYVYRRDAGRGAWTIEATLAAPLGSDLDSFGAAVDVEGDLIAVGASGEGTGAVHLFRHDGAAWNLEASIGDSSPQPFGAFGTSVALSGDAIAVGARGDNGFAGSQTGSVTIYRRIGAFWLFESEIFADDARPFAHFGSAVDLEGDRLLVGAEDDAPAAPDTGSAYVFERDGGGTWVQAAKLHRQAPGFSTFFGGTVALDGDVAVIGIGGSSTSSPAIQPGSATIFERDGGAWSPVAVFTDPNARAGDDFGAALALREGRLAVGAPRTDQACGCDPTCDSGSALLYELVGGAWTLVGKLRAPGVQAGDWYGRAVALGRGRLFVGAPFDDDLAIDAGSITRFDLDGDDCNANGLCDALELAAGTVPDADGNGVPDGCDPDCDDNGVPDALDIAGGAADADRDGVPDVCQDCDGNGVLDSIDVARGAPDCDGNGIPDDCDPDCDGDGLSNACAIAAGAPDCDGNGVPDDCQGDCDGNGVADLCDLATGAADDCNGNGRVDACDIADGTSLDADGDGVPDECGVDCNGNGIPDVIDVACTDDCNDNGIPDECEPDCDQSGFPDACEIAMGWTSDCNGNGVPDYCDTVLLGTSPDCDGDHAPDECDPTPFCLGNTDFTCSVDVADLVNVILDWDTDGSAHFGDVNRDGIVDVLDLVTVIVEWGSCFDPACGPGAGPCYVPNGTPGCDDEACCSITCDLDPFCCEVQWDQVCVDESPCGSGVP